MKSVLPAITGTRPIWRFWTSHRRIVHNFLLRKGRALVERGLLCWELLDLVHAQPELVREAVLLRSGLTIGNVFVDNAITFGPALIRAFELENDVAVSPRVIVDLPGRRRCSRAWSKMGGRRMSTCAGKILD
jgi:hypothetical protein